MPARWLRAADTGRAVAARPARLVRPVLRPRGATAGVADASAGTPAFVLVLGENGQPAPRRIMIGSSDDRNTQVLSGLQPGEQVVIGQTVEGSASRPSGQTSILPGAGGRPGGAGGAVQKPTGGGAAPARGGGG